MAESRAGRVTFNPDPDVEWLLPPTDKRGVRAEFLNNAVRQFARPPVTFWVADADDIARERLREFVAEATDHILIVGISLQFIVESCRDILEQKVKDGVVVSVILARTQFGKNSPLGKALRLRLGGQNAVTEMVRQIQASTEFFTELRDLGKAHGTPVQVRTCGEIPAIGLVVRDRRTPHQRTRVHLYTSVTLTHRHPVIDIDPVAPGGTEAYNACYGHYEELRERVENLSERR